MTWYTLQMFCFRAYSLGVSTSSVEREALPEADQGVHLMKIMQLLPDLNIGVDRPDATFIVKAHIVFYFLCIQRILSFVYTG